MSNSAVLKGGETLFLTTLTLVSLPTASSPFLMVPMRRMSEHRGVELAAAAGVFRAANITPIHADLVDEMTMQLVFLIVAELAQRLAHQTGLQAGQRIAHFAFDFGLRRERSDRVDHDQVDRAGTHQRIDDLERLLAGVGLADEQVGKVHAELLRILHVERVLGIDETQVPAGVAFRR